MLLQELGMAHDQATLKAIFRRSIPLTMQDVVLVFVTVSGERGSPCVQGPWLAQNDDSTVLPEPILEQDFA